MRFTLRSEESLAPDHHQKRPPATRISARIAASMSRTANFRRRRARKNRTKSAAIPKTATVMAISIIISLQF